MAITAALCDSYKQEILQGIHSSADTYKVALYPSTATLGTATTAYSSTGEVTGTGYTAGGNTLSGFTVSLSGDTAVLTFANTNWPSSTITARGALIYNSSKSNKAVAAVSFGASDITSTNGTFQITWPTADATNGLIRIL
jgi:hypothetical protein